jgi:PBP1b-binding outer membrane lipoprotein LpoB
MKILKSICLFALLLTLAACAGTTPEPTVQVQPELSTPTAIIKETEEILQPVASFESSPCPFDVPEGAPVECGFVVVPEDHNEPGGSAWPRQS